MPVTSREVHLIARPDGMPRPEEFAIVERVVPDAGEGQIQVRNMYLSVDPAMRPRLSAQQPLNEAMAGGAIGRVVQSRHPSYKEGDIVQHWNSFREYFVSEGRGVAKVQADPALPVSVYLHTLGGSGFVAYGGLLEIGKLQDGEQVFVSTAAGSVGSVAVQVAKIKNCYVIGSTGSDEKCRWLRDDLGIDVAINYKTEPIRTALKANAPKGIDVYFDNVGGDHLEAALPRMNLLGRIPVCGMISAYNNAGSISSPVTTLSNIIYSRVTIRGFVAPDFMHLREQFAAEMTGWLKDGRVKYRETIHDGIESAPAALIGMLNGENIGKMMVRLGE
jgi:NADPH-dependent curcumin reductase CurA